MTHPSLASMSDEELLKMLDGFTPESTPDSNPLSHMSDEELLAMLPPEYQKASGEATPSFGQKLARRGRDLVAGISNAPDLVYAPYNIYKVGKYFVDKGLADKNEKVEVPEISSFGIGNKVGNFIDDQTGNYTKPGEDEALASGATQAVGEMLGTFGMGSGLKLASTATKIPTMSKFWDKSAKVAKFGNAPTASNIAATAATSAIMHKNQDDPLLGLGLGLGTSYGIHKGAHALRKGAIRGSLAKLTKMNPEKVEALREAGISPLYGDISDSKMVKGTQNMLRKSLPFVGDAIETSANKQYGDVMKGLGQIENSGRSSVQGGELAKRAADKAKEGFSLRADKLWDKVTNHIGKGDSTLVHPTHSDTLLTDATKELKSVGALKTFQESPMGKWHNRFQEYKIQGDRIDANELRNLRRHIGKEIDWKQPTVEDKQLIDLYHSINEDLGSYFKTKGKDAAKAWNDFNEYTSDYIQNSRPIVRGIHKKYDQEAVKAFMEATPTRSQIKKTEYVLKNLDVEDQKEFFHTIVHEKGLTNGRFEPLKAVRGLQSMPKEHLTSLLKHSGLTEPEQKKFRYVMKSVDNIRDTLAEQNFSRSGYTNISWKIFTGGAGASLVGIPWTLAGLGIARYATNKTITNGKFINWIYEGLKLKNERLTPRWIQKLDKIPGVSPEVKTKIANVYKSLQDEQHAVTPRAHQKALSTVGHRLASFPNKERN